MANELNKLSDKKVKALYGKSVPKIEFVADGAGLSAKVSVVGGVSWVFTYRLDGKKLSRLTLGRYPDMSLKEARGLRDKCRNWLASGKDPKLQLNLDIQKSLKPVTVRDALEYWIENYARDNRTNVNRHIAQLEKHIYPYIGEMALSDCETRYWLTCFDRSKKESPVATGYIFQMCKQALKFCRVRRYAISSALDDLTIPDVGKKQNKRDRVLTDKELGKLWESTNENAHIPYYDYLLRILIIFGCRSHEARLSEWKEWDFDNWLWTVPREHTKTDEKITRPIPIYIRSVIAELYNLNKYSGYLLGELKKPEAISQFGRNLWKKLEHSEAWTLHDLRRTFATKLNDMGIAPHIVEQLLGHALPGIMAIYNKSQYLPEKLDALNKWCERLDVLAGNYENVVILKAAQ
ncbi:tyrosine-type recombinase/integrase [Xenorhabdus bovienii]|uniref:tyrosine-type recombinase/integrase n=1 Tax=Xenorhabdus bovienii TaxID=40576 RepID=UPI00237CB950|nr:site-specific integrase [Xenorhabdus bovienii]MDE1488052.1 tyrosine-type recombinase/integrase [Xenorhabdus bovienii]MDE9478935.1 tyrosine-type recombinase/integrase [Xenorhabdus bovienii]MDE9531771.1 tyrosine-type recombinase/integrase [Xenorhabdus bovienii]